MNCLGIGLGLPTNKIFLGRLVCVLRTNKTLKLQASFWRVFGQGRDWDSPSVRARTIREAKRRRR